MADAKYKAAYSRGGSCDHAKPLFANGKERKFCFDCVPKPAPRPRKPYTNKIVNTATCANPECQKAFQAGRYNSKYCCEKCRLRVNNTLEVKREKLKAAGCYGSSHRRRARRNGGKVERFTKEQVFDRDKWRCQICGIDTPKELKGSFFHSAPELDHIVPLSRGGDHTKENSRCACRSCNQFKSNKTDAEMLSLLAA